MISNRRPAPLRTRPLRLVVAATVGLAVMAGASGCSMISPQATTISYSASDGVNIPSSGPLEVRNVFIVADEAGTVGNVIAAIVNDTDATETLNVGIDGRVATVQVPARSVVHLGVDGVAPLRIEGLGSKPGSMVLAAFQSGNGEGVEVSVPVLDGTLPQYADLVPAPSLVVGG